jgi:cytoplasmic FMR1 interacting protein
MIKGLQVLMARMETVFTEAVRRHVYARLQTFIQVALREPLRKAVKNKKDLIKRYDYLNSLERPANQESQFFSILVSVRETCADWPRGYKSDDDPAMKGKKDPDNGVDIKVPKRNVGKLRFKKFVTI